MVDRLFILDDDEVLLKLLKEHFSDLNYEVDVAHLIYEAKEQLTGSIYSVAIVDLGLSVIDHTDGIDIIKFIRERCPTTRIIVYTGNDNQDIKQLALRLGADFFIIKPVSLSYLEEIVSKFCDRKPE
jgi:two-component system response regulator HydG